MGSSGNIGQDSAAERDDLLIGRRAIARLSPCRMIDRPKGNCIGEAQSPLINTRFGEHLAQGGSRWPDKWTTRRRLLGTRGLAHNVKSRSDGATSRVDAPGIEARLPLGRIPIRRPRLCLGSSPHHPKSGVSSDAIPWIGLHIMPAGEGSYAITLLGGQMHLSYLLELPEHPSEVQRAFRIAPEASFALSIKNPEASTPPGVGLRDEEKADYPDQLQAEFGDRRFGREDVRMLDYPGAEFILVGARSDREEADGKGLASRKDMRWIPDMFRQLHLQNRRHPVKPLFEGKWE
jgi:hypothetical protein